MKPMVYQAERKDREVLDKGTYKGYEYEIVSLGTHPCAYVTLPKKHPYADMDYDEIWAKVPGGLTYKSGLVIGWDYAHAGDQYGAGKYEMSGHAWTTEEIFADVCECIDGLIESEKSAPKTQSVGRSALLIKTTGESSFVTPKNGTDFTLEELYQLLGCDMVEVVYPAYESDCIFIIDEEGKLTGKDINYPATMMWGAQRDALVGDVIFCHTSMLK